MGIKSQGPEEHHLSHPEGLKTENASKRRKCSPERGVKVVEGSVANAKARARREHGEGALFRWEHRMRAGEGAGRGQGSPTT